MYDILCSVPICIVKRTLVLSEILLCIAHEILWLPGLTGPHRLDHAGLAWSYQEVESTFLEVLYEQVYFILYIVQNVLIIFSIASIFYLSFR